MKFKLEAASGDMKKWTNILVSKGFLVTFDTSDKYTRFNVELNSAEDFVAFTKLVDNKIVLDTTNYGCSNIDDPNRLNLITIYDDYLE